jgi:polyhydroxybutyrate depolymerase
MSNGATMAGRLACERPERIAAFAQVAGTAAVEVAARCRASVPVPILQIHGTADRATPYRGGRRRGVRAPPDDSPSGGPAIGVDEWARLWVRANEAEPEPRVERLPLDTIVRRWRGPSPGSDVDFYAVHGAATRGRAAVSRCRVPSSVARATPSTRLIWQFLHSHARDP